MKRTPFIRLWRWTSLAVPLVLNFACHGVDRDDSFSRAQAAPNSGDAGGFGLAPRVELGPQRYANKEIFIDAQTTGAVSWQWEQLAGPGLISFQSPDAEDTAVNANRDGLYWLRLTVKGVDGTESFGDVKVLWDTVAPCPTLTPEIKTFHSVFVDGKVPEDATLIEWRQLSGPGAIAFSSPKTSATNIEADLDGTYGIRLTATDKVGNVCSADLSFIWETTVPTVSVGPDVSTNKEILIDAASVEASTFSWTQVSGPGTIRFSNPSSEDTKVSANVDGDYVLRLTITTMSGLIAFDELNLHWDTAAPTVSLGPDLQKRYRAIIDARTTEAASYSWAKVSGPGKVTFSSETLEDTALIADQAGSYEISLTVKDLAGNTASDTIRIDFENDPRVFSKEISSGGSHTCAILDDDSVACWGYNYSQELGYGDANKYGEGTDRYLAPSFPINLGSSKTAVHLSVNYAHSCAILNDGSVKCWGQNTSGQLGYGDNKKLGTPAATSIAIGEKARAIATGLAHTCVITESGAVKCWGANSAGQLGYGDYTARLAPPSLPVDLGAGRSAKSLSLGAYHSCAILDNDSLKCWGNNSNGQLGLADRNYRNKPDEAVSFAGNLRTKSITAGAYHTCAILENGASYCWGRGKQGQLGYGDLNDRLASEAPALNINGRSVKNLSAGLSHTCALYAEGDVQCWGLNDEAQLGVGDKIAQISSANASPIAFGGASVKSLSAGRLHSCAILDDSTLKCWGSNSYGQLGAGKTFADMIPPLNVAAYGD